MKAKKQPKPKKDALTRAIEAKVRAIASGKRRINALYVDAAEKAATIQKGIALNMVLLDALKRGSLKP